MFCLAGFVASIRATISSTTLTAAFCTLLVITISPATGGREAVRQPSDEAFWQYHEPIPSRPSQQPLWMQHCNHTTLAGQIGIVRLHTSCLSAGGVPFSAL